MHFSSKKIDCQSYDKYSKRENPFTVVEYIFNYFDSNDKKFIDECIKEGKKLSIKVNPNAANLSSTSRTSTKVFINSVAGILAEKTWLHFLSQIKIDAISTIYDNPKNQIDIYLTELKKTIEIRSSFPRNGVEFALCHPKYQFDIIGPYKNDYKSNEFKKDYYGRVLYPFSVYSFWKTLKSNNLKVYLTGGATWKMMGDNNISIKKDLIPEDIYNIELVNKKSQYLVIPFSKALDMQDMTKELKK